MSWLLSARLLTGCAEESAEGPGSEAPVSCIGTTSERTDRSSTAPAFKRTWEDRDRDGRVVGHRIDFDGDGVLERVETTVWSDDGSSDTRSEDTWAHGASRADTRRDALGNVTDQLVDDDADGTVDRETHTVHRYQLDADGHLLDQLSVSPDDDAAGTHERWEFDADGREISYQLDGYWDARVDGVWDYENHTSWSADGLTATTGGSGQWEDNIASETAECTFHDKAATTTCTNPDLRTVERYRTFNWDGTLHFSYDCEWDEADRQVECAWADAEGQLGQGTTWRYDARDRPVFAFTEWADSDQWWSTTYTWDAEGRPTLEASESSSGLATASAWVYSCFEPD